MFELSTWTVVGDTTFEFKLVVVRLGELRGTDDRIRPTLHHTKRRTDHRSADLNEPSFKFGMLENHSILERYCLSFLAYNIVKDIPLGR